MYFISENFKVWLLEIYDLAVEASAPNSIGLLPIIFWNSKVVFPKVGVSKVGVSSFLVQEKRARLAIIVENTIFEFFIFNKVSNNYWNLRYNIYE